jgi:hypothetical protein
MIRSNRFLLFLILGTALVAQIPLGYPPTDTINWAANSTNNAEVLQARQQLELAKVRARQAILNPVAPPDYSYLENKDMKHMSSEEFNAFLDHHPELQNALIEKSRTPAQKEAAAKCLQAIMDPIGVNRELDRTKSPEQWKQEADAARAFLNPRIPSLKEFHSESVARPQ